MIQHSGNTWRDVSDLLPSLRSSDAKQTQLLPPATVAPSIPVLSTTILQLELLLQESALDLAAISVLLLTDMGAVIQLLRASAADAARPEDRTHRVGDCIASLGTDAWFNAVTALPFIPERNAAMTATTEHARTIAELAQTLAPEFGLCPEISYIVGLLHEIHHLPATLGWGIDDQDYRPAQQIPRSPAPHTGKLCRFQQHLWQPEKDFLPLPIAAALREVRDPRTPSVWRRLLQDAHELAPLSQRENDDRAPLRPPHLMARQRAMAGFQAISIHTPRFKPMQFLPRASSLQRQAAVV